MTPLYGGAINISFGKAGQLPVGDDNGELILPTRDSPSVLTTVAGNPVRGYVS